MADSKQIMRDALKQIKKLKQELSVYHKKSYEPIAVIGMGCRFPDGANSPQAFWEKLARGDNFINPHLNNERWDMDRFYDKDPDAPGKIYCKSMGLVDDLDKFDAEFFGISPREAEDIDPQHRLLLEVSYETMEYAGYAPSRLAGSNTGVYVGIASSDYAHLGSILGKPEQITPWQGIGNALSAAAGRLSYLYNFKGPAVAFDTACSSSLVALHHACNALRQGECDSALAGGVHLVLNPAVSIVFAKARMLSPEGLCKTFDKDADGYVRSEGCGLLMLKRLSDAERDGDKILGLIKGSAINQDGKSQGFTAPNESAQIDVINKALQQAQLDPLQIDYVEAHGTGTSLGDPIELNALNQAYCDGRTADSPLLVGSVKTNMGHAEAAAGTASLIKMLLSMQHHYLPKHLHFDTPNPFVPWQTMPIKVNDKGREWGAESNRSHESNNVNEASGDVLRCGVSGFAFTGTNAHIILESYSAPDSTTDTTSDTVIDSQHDEDESVCPVLLISSATKPAALEAKRHQLHGYLNQDLPGSMASMAASLAKGKDHFKYREAYLGSAIESLKNSVDANPDASKNYFFGENKRQQKLCLVLPEINETSLNTWCRLNDTLPRYQYHFDLVRSMIQAVCDEYASHHETSGILECIDIQNFIGLLACASLWRDWGLNVDCFIGRKQGELIAAHLAGMLSLRDTCKLALLMINKATLNPASLEDFSEANIELTKPRVRLLSQYTGTHCPRKMTEIQYWLQSDERLIEENAYQGVLEEQGIDIVFQLGGYETFLAVDSIVCQDLQGDEEPLNDIERALAQLYVLGVEFNWSKIYSKVKAVDRPLPTYPFQRKYCWNPVLQDIDGCQKPQQQASVPDISTIYSLSWKTINHAMLSKPLNDNPIEGAVAGDDWLLLYPATFSPVPEIAINSIAVDLAMDEKHFHSSIERTLIAKKEALNGKPLKLLLSFVGLESLDYLKPIGLLLRIAQFVRRSENVTLSVITQSAVSLESESSQSEELGVKLGTQAAIYGALKSLALELPERFRLGLDIETTTELDAQLLKSINCLVDTAHLNPWLALRQGRFYAPQLDRAEPIVETKRALSIDPSAFYVIAGGTGGIGLSIAEWLVKQGAKNIVLLSRSGAKSQRAIDVIESMEARGVRVLLPQVDIADSESLSLCLDSLRSEREIKGVVHAAGIFELAPIQELTLSKCKELMDNKVLGMHWLDQLTRKDPLDYFVGFSSIAAVWGSAGNFHYAGANHAINRIMASRRHQGHAGVVINWGPWKDSGMVSDSSKEMAEKRGLGTLTHQEAIAVFEYLLVSDRSDQIVVDVDWNKFKPLMSLTSVGAMFDAIEGSLDEQSGIPEALPALSDADQSFKQQFELADASQQQNMLLEYLKNQLATALQVEAFEIDEYQPLIEMGIDSLMAVEFKNRALAITQAELPLVRLLNGANLLDVASLLVSTENQNQQSESLDDPFEDEIIEGVL